MYVPHIGILYPVLVNTDASCDSNNLVYSKHKVQSNISANVSQNNLHCIEKGGSINLKNRYSFFEKNFKRTNWNFYINKNFP